MQAKTRYNLWRGVQATAVAGMFSGLGGCVYSCNSTPPENHTVKMYNFYEGQIRGAEFKGIKFLLKDESEYLRYRDLLQKVEKLENDPVMKEYKEAYADSTIHGFLGLILFFASAGIAAKSTDWKDDAETDLRYKIR